MVFINRKIVLIIIIIIPNIIFSGETIPTNSWIYHSVEILQAAGYFKNLDQGNKPWNRSDIASELLKIDVDEFTSQSVKTEFMRLRFEFRQDIESGSAVINESENPAYFHLSTCLSDEYSSSTRNYLAFKLSGALQLIHNLTLKYGGYVDQKFSDDPWFSGYEWSGFQGYQEQMYIYWGSDNIGLKFGRDYIKWGYGHTGNLFISDNSRPFDQISLKAKSRIISFQFIISQLDIMYNANRYLNASRFEIKPVKNLFIGFGQSSLYGGENQPFDFTMSNPLAFYSFTQDNDKKAMNMMLYADLAWYFLNKYKLYGEFLVDDYQIDHQVKSDLEPNELAFLIGLQGVDLIWDIRGWLEFVQVRNRTYNVPDVRPFEKFLHKNMPIAHPMGTDFQMLALRIDKWLSGHFRLDFNYSLLRKGEGTIRGKFTEPWLADDITMDKGYTEKIPYGIVETTNTIIFGVHYEINSRIQSDLGVSYFSIFNFNHIKGMTDFDFSVFGRLYIDYKKLVPF